MARPTLKDIAAQAGVSFQTVSLVVNHPEKVADDTRLRVREVIDRLGFVPDMAARTLRNIKSKTIACIIGQGHRSYEPTSRSMQEVYLGLLVQAFARATDEAGYALIQRYASDQSEATVARLCGMIAEGRVDGIIVIPFDENDRFVEELQRRRYNYIAYGVAKPEWHFIARQNPIDEVIDHLAATGRRRIAFTRSERNGMVTPEVLHYFALYQAALVRHGLPFRPELVVASNWTSPGGYETARALLAQAPDADAVIASNDRVALGMLKAFHDQGVNVPGQIAVVGADNFAFGEFTVPSLTSIDVPTMDMAQFAINTLIARVEDKFAGTQLVQKIFPGRLVVRDSTGRKQASTSFCEQKAANKL